MRPAALFLLPIILTAAELRIDHVTIAGKSLQSMQAQLMAAGMKVEPGGVHTNHATEMAIASFPDGSYLELIALQNNYDAATLAQHPWSQYIQGDAGPCAWAARPKDFPAEVARLRAVGLNVTNERGGRTRPDGVALEWESATIGDQAAGVFFPFLIHDITSRDNRARTGGKPANRDQSGVLRVVIGVTKLSVAVDRFQRAYPDIGHPLKQLDQRFGAELAWLPDSPVIFAAPLSSSSPLARRVAHFGEGPCAFILASKKELKGAWKGESRWFGRDVKWLDPDKLGWNLGIEEE